MNDITGTRASGRRRIDWGTALIQTFCMGTGLVAGAIAGPALFDSTSVGMIFGLGLGVAFGNLYVPRTPADA